MNRLKSQLISNCNHIGFSDTNIVFPTNDYNFKNIINNYSGICNTFELQNCKFYDDTLNILLEKLISSNIKNIILKNCNTIDTVFLYNMLKRYNVVLDLLDLTNTNHNNNLICELIKLNKIKYLKLGDKQRGVALYSEEKNKESIINYKLNQILESQKQSYTIIDINYLLPNEYVFYYAFKPKNNKENNIKLEANNIINLIKDTNYKNSKKYIVNHIKNKI